MDRHKEKPQRAIQGLRHFANTLFEMVHSHRDVLFKCPLCSYVLKGPVTADCGHTYCAECVPLLPEGRCVECCEFVNPRTSINVLVHGILTRWRECNPYDRKPENFLPETKDLLGYEPRYHLRSRFAGSPVRDVNKVLKRLVLSKHCKIPMDKFLRKAAILTENGPMPSSAKCDNNKFPKSYSRFAYSRTVLDATDKILKKVHQQEVAALRTCWNCISLSDFDCILCSRCFFEPVTTACGHTFCKECLARVFDHGLACPLCMSPLRVNDQVRNPTTIIENAIKTLYGNEYHERLKNSKTEKEICMKQNEIPVFVCTNAFPGVACPLYIYEPRYRLLARRCLQSPNKKFGMALKTDNRNRFASFGTLLQATDAVLLEDGRSILTTIGIRRFRVLSKDEQDGYDTARVSYISDAEVPVDKMQDLVDLHYRVHAKATKWINSLTFNLLGEVERSIGKMPTVEKDWATSPDGPSWAWWLMSILPMSSQLQVGFLCSTSLEKRLRAIDKMLEHMKVKMQALERNTLNCTDSLKTPDSCAMHQRPLHFRQINSH